MPIKKRDEKFRNRMKNAKSMSISNENKNKILILQDMMEVKYFSEKKEKPGFIANDAITYLLKKVDYENLEIDKTILDEILSNGT